MSDLEVTTRYQFTSSDSIDRLIKWNLWVCPKRHNFKSTPFLYFAENYRYKFFENHNTNSSNI